MTPAVLISNRDSTLQVFNLQTKQQRCAGGELECSGMRTGQVLNT